MTSRMVLRPYVENNVTVSLIRVRKKIRFSRFQGNVPVMNSFLECSIYVHLIPFGVFLRQNMNVVKHII
jgi:hypothetical protein